VPPRAKVLATGDTDVSALPAQVSVPTLVMHARDDARVPFDCTLHPVAYAAGTGRRSSSDP
jgi:pimeloyl-ACP methyl ester carboxylesterase